LAIVPVVGAIAGAVGTAAQITQAGSQAANQRAQLAEQERQMTEQRKLLTIQRDNQRVIVTAEAARAKQLESIASSANLFNIALQEQSLNSQKVADELNLRAQQFQVDQQKTMALTEAYGQELSTFQGLFQAAQQGQQEQETLAATLGQATGVAAQRGQQNTASAQALQDRIVMDAQNSYQQSSQLFESLTAQSKQNLETSRMMAELQQQLGEGDIKLARSMGEFNRSAGLMQLDAQRQQTLIEQQMNNAAMDEELSAQQYGLQTAASTEQMNLMHAQRLNRIQQSGANGPGLLGALPSLVQSGLGVYSAFNPPAPLPPRTTNPLYSVPPPSANSLSNTAFSGRSLSGLPRFGSNWPRQGVNTDVTNRLFNIG